MTRSGANRGVTVVAERKAKGGRGCPVSHPEHGDTPTIPGVHGGNCWMGGMTLDGTGIGKSGSLGQGERI